VGYVKLDVEFGSEVRRRLRSRSVSLHARSRVQGALFALTLAITDRNEVVGTRAQLADIAGVHRETFRPILEKLRELGLVRYDERRRVLLVNPQLAFIGSEKVRHEEIRRWRERERIERERVAA
jgi:hypothetical protein